MSLLPDKALRCVPEHIRKTMGKAGQTAEEGHAAFVARTEAELQRKIEQMLTREGIFVVRQRMDKKSNIRVGTPDILFSVRRADGSGQAVAFEVKLPGCKPRPEQIAAMEAMAINGWRVCVITSYDQARLELKIARGYDLH